MRKSLGKRFFFPFYILVQYLKDSYQEFRHVTWPNRPTIMQYTVLVLITIGVGALVLTVFDYGLQQVMNLYLIK